MHVFFFGVRIKDPVMALALLFCEGYSFFGSVYGGFCGHVPISSDGIASVYIPVLHIHFNLPPLSAFAQLEHGGEITAILGIAPPNPVFQVLKLLSAA
jgi:hypothetical protein